MKSPAPVLAHQNHLARAVREAILERAWSEVQERTVDAIREYKESVAAVLEERYLAVHPTSMYAAGVKAGLAQAFDVACGVRDDG